MVDLSVLASKKKASNKLPNNNKPSSNNKTPSHSCKLRWISFQEPHKIVSKIMLE
jgi:hypothetical protein